MRSSSGIAMVVRSSTSGTKGFWSGAVSSTDEPGLRRVRFPLPVLAAIVFRAPPQVALIRSLLSSLSSARSSLDCRAGSDDVEQVKQDDDGDRDANEPHEDAAHE